MELDAPTVIQTSESGLVSIAVANCVEAPSPGAFRLSTYDESRDNLGLAPAGPAVKRGETTITMDDRMFDSMVAWNYPLAKYEIVPDNLMNNGDTWTMDVVANTGDDIVEFDRWQEGEKVMGIGIYQICADLIRMGKMPAGKVIINASW